MQLPRLYPIVDATFFTTSKDLYVFCEELSAGGVTLLQYRNKSGGARLMLEHAVEIKRLIGSRVQLIMNDRADLCLAAGFDGVHVGQDDLSPAAVRRVIGPELMLGVSTHNAEQLASADQTTADYLAIGPVFKTSSKEKPDPTVGLEGVRRAEILHANPS